MTNTSSIHMSPWRGMIVSLSYHGGELTYKATALSGAEHIIWNGVELAVERDDGHGLLKFSLDGVPTSLKVGRLDDRRGRFSLAIAQQNVSEVFDVRYRPFKRVMARKFLWVIILAALTGSAWASGLIGAETAALLAILTAVLPAVGTRGEWSIHPRNG